MLSIRQTGFQYSLVTRKTDISQTYSYMQCLLNFRDKKLENILENDIITFKFLIRLMKGTHTVHFSLISNEVDPSQE